VSAAIPSVSHMEIIHGLNIHGLNLNILCTKLDNPRLSKMCTNGISTKSLWEAGSYLLSILSIYLDPCPVFMLLLTKLDNPML